MYPSCDTAGDADFVHMCPEPLHDLFIAAAVPASVFSFPLWF